VLSIFSGSQLVQAEVRMQEITSLEESTWVFKSGMSRAKYHDRQNLVMVLNSGATIRIRKKSTTDGYSNLKFWCWKIIEMRKNPLYYLLEKYY